MNFATFFAQAIRERTKKVKKGKFRGNLGSMVKNQALIQPAMPYTAQPSQPGMADVNAYTGKG